MAMNEHTVKSYGDELNAADRRGARAWAAWPRPRSPTPSTRWSAATWPWPGRWSSATTELDAMQSEIERKAIRLIALRQPMAYDLRRTLAAMKTGLQSGAHRRPGQEHRQARPGAWPRPSR